MEFAGVIAIIFALSLTVTKVVDLIRNIADKGDIWPKWAWNVAAFAVGVAFCLGWEKSFAQDLLRLVPAFADDTDNLAGFGGYLVSGVILGGLSGFGHEFLDYLSSSAKSQ
jgi:hypothetical protein